MDMTPSPMTSGSAAAPVDLEMRVTLTTVDGKQAFKYTLSSPSGVVPFESRGFLSEPILRPAEDFHRRLLGQIEQLSRNEDIDGKPLLETEIVGELEDLGRALYRQLFPAEMRDAYRRFREAVRTLLIISDEPWIPWELVKPFDDGDPDDVIDDDFLCARFQLTRWLAGAAPPAETLQLRRLAHIEVGRPPEGTLLSGDPSVFADLAGVDSLSLPQAGYDDVVNLLRVGEIDLVHFAGHGEASADRSDEARLVLAGRQSLQARNVAGPLILEIKKRRPLVFLNACRAAQQGWLLTGLGGWADAWVRRCQCSAFVAPHWAVRDNLARAFAETFYQALLYGATVGSAAQQARQRVRTLRPGRPTWLAYVVYAHPNARLLFDDTPVQTLEALRVRRPEPEERRDSLLLLPRKIWQRNLSPPGALLQAEYGVVPFHGREKELEALRSWCEDDCVVAVRLCTGPGGMGKTRLAIETCRQMRERGWQAGLLPYPDERPPAQVWHALTQRGGPALVVVDYAETRRQLLVHLLREAHASAAGRSGYRIRLILLARAALDWWDQLKTEGDGVGDLLSGPATSLYSLDPPALSVEERRSIYHQAGTAFSEQLDRPPSAAEPGNLDPQVALENPCFTD